MNNRENQLKRKDKQRIRDCGTVKKHLVFMSSESQKMRMKLKKHFKK